MIKIKGRLLLNETLLADGCIISKDCKFTIPEKVPIVWNFDHSPEGVIGSGTVSEDDKGLLLDGIIFDDKLKENTQSASEKGGIGGFYNKVKYDKDIRKRNRVTEANVVKASILPGGNHSPIHPDFTFKIVED